VGGRFRGLTLADVGAGDPAAHLRPTSDRVRESLFNILQGGRYGTPLAGARVLDLFAGTGALGLEALSRGAVFATFIENGATALALLRENIAKTRTQAETTILPRDATAPGAGQPHDLVFLDPPYGKGLGEQALIAARAHGWLAPEALIVWEERTPMPAPEGFTPRESRRYGDTHITLLAAP
jgi:16S rRNA (guanine966-N2)-methyltransferase